MNDPVLACRALQKRFERTTAVDRFDLEVHAGETLVLLGPSGCGKTTVLRLIAGLLRPDAGEIRLGGRIAAGDGRCLAPEERKVGMVFQDWALFPQMDVRRNVAFGAPGPERVNELLVMLGIADLGDRMPHELSGGQQQRVAIARALAPSPDVLLLDEPFSNLDATLRARVRREVRDVLSHSGVTTIFVTHDQEEALSIADRLAVMARGRILQVGTSWEVYERPASLDVAWMVGRANLLPVEVRDELARGPLGPMSAKGVPDGPAVAVVRPEQLAVSTNGAARAEIVSAEFFGHDQLLTLRLDPSTSVEVLSAGSTPHLEPGRRVGLEVTGSPRYFPQPI
ncbi:MAG: ABC transporter ATP-binding protein [Actinomycetota bacterium]